MSLIRSLRIFYKTEGLNTVLYGSAVEAKKHWIKGKRETGENQVCVCWPRIKKWIMVWD